LEYCSLCHALSKYLVVVRKKCFRFDKSNGETGTFIINLNKGVIFKIDA